MSLIDKLEDLVIKVDTEYQEKMEAVIREIVPGMPEGNVRHAAECMCTDKDVWEFLNKMNIKHCDLYDKGMKRIGCILCPMSSIGEMMKYPFDYPHQTKKFLNEIEIFVKDGHYQELGENPNMVLAWYLSKRTVDDFKGLVRRVQSGKFKPNKKNRELWDRFIDYFDIKNAKF